MKSGLLIVGFALYSVLGYSQENDLKHLKGNTYLIITEKLNTDSIRAHVQEHFAELEKNEWGWVNTIVLNSRNDTLTIIDYDAKGQKQRIFFDSGQRRMRAFRSTITVN